MSLTQDQIEERMKSVIGWSFSLEQSEITQGLSFDDLNADSLDMTEFVMGLEEEFEIEIPEEDSAKFKTAGDVYEYLVEKLL